MNKTVSILAFIVCLSSTAISESKNLDSLYSVWKNDALPDSIRVDAYNTYIREGVLFSNPDSAFSLAAQIIEFSSASAYLEGESIGYMLQGLSHSIRSNFSQALDCFANALKIDEQLNDKNGVASILGNIGVVHRKQGNYPKALSYFQRSMVIMEELDDKWGIATTLMNIGNIHYTQKNYAGALEYFQSSLKIFEELKDKRSIANLLLNIGVVYELLDDELNALNNFKRCLAIYEEIGSTFGVSVALLNLAHIYKKQGDYSDALDHLRRSLALSQKIEDKEGAAQSLLAIGDIFRLQANYTQALDYCHKSLLTAEDISLTVQKDACDCLYLTYKSLGNSNKALKFYEQFTLLKDSLYNEENTKELTRLEMQHDFDKKEALAKSEQEKKDALVLKELQRQKLVRNSFVGGFTVMLLFAGVFFAQRNRISKEKKRSDELLLNILPAEVAEELKSKGSAEAKQFDQVTVLFTDFKNFTLVAEKLSAKELVNEVNFCYSEFDKIISKHRIEKIKTIGDAYMCAGGLPVPRKSDAEDAVHAAIEICNFMKKENEKRAEQGRTFFEIRIGLHTGPVVAGIVGIKKFAYDIWGDTVNLAARMEQNSEAGKINISGTTYELVKHKFNCEHRGKIEAKNKGQLDMYFVETNS